MNPQLEELACLYVLDRLDAGERASFEACLLHNPQLAGLVGELESALDRRIHALAQIEPPAGLLAQIDARIDRLQATAPAAPAGKVMSFWPALARWGIAALLAVGLGAMAIQYLRRGPATVERPFVIIVGLDSRQSTLAELPLAKHAPDADACFIQLASLAERFWEKPEELPVKLRSPAEGGRGYALFDPASNQGFIAVQQLPVIGHGQRYHLWILDTTSGQTREAGVLPLTDSNRGLYFFSVAPAGETRPGHLDFFITAEDTNATQSTLPHGKVVLGEKKIF